MRALKLALVILLLAATVEAVNLTITVPANAITTSGDRLDIDFGTVTGSVTQLSVYFTYQDMCEELRVELRARSADWSNDLCATLFTRLGIRVYLARVERRGQVQTIDAAVDAAIAQFDTDWPLPFIPAECGDSTVDSEFGEECDPPNGTTCSAQCQDIP